MSNKIKEFIHSVRDNEGHSALKLFNSIIKEKIANAIQLKKVEVAKSLYTESAVSKLDEAVKYYGVIAYSGVNGRQIILGAGPTKQDALADAYGPDLGAHELKAQLKKMAGKHYLVQITQSEYRHHVGN